ncbi:inosose isomerase [Geomicrobium sp. JCM 19037]|uniref:sugar phosphate isomerase/epimerase family protein n=1 Tax=Geomicrobium sp. JCM 19037 TaxID=1460634 RepID=UPI00045F139E|nr:sugar phosphate isomerase/epimerase [Geomicrobium sp. JCM 19037]GAK03034.1 inosose isomerase [Geomicrobium sp. JCM 19037]
MKIGLFTVLFQNLTTPEMIEKVSNLGIEAIELGTGNFPGDAHCQVDELLNSETAREQFLNKLRDANIEISGLSCQGNPIHPDSTIASTHHEILEKTILLAKKLGISVVNCFSGCPGDHENARHPNWITCAWPAEYAEIREWQWEHSIVPYWKKQAKFAEDYGVKIALEMHPGFAVYNPETLMELRKRTGSTNIGANFDPSHLIWQGIDPVVAIKYLGSEQAIFHFHAKDTYLDRSNINVNGVLDTKDYRRGLERAWTFRTVGYGMSESMWKNMLSALSMVNYTGVLSIEHEDQYASIEEGLARALEFLKRIRFQEKPTEMWWA